MNYSFEGTIYATASQQFHLCSLFSLLCSAINDERVPHYDAPKTARFVVAITVVYNMRILARVPHFEDIDEAALRNLNIHDHENDEEPDEPEDDGQAVANLLARGRAARQRIVEELEAARARRH